MKARHYAAVAITAALAIGGLASAPASAGTTAAATPVVQASSEAAERAYAAGCGWNASKGGERAYYEHCATNTNVWIQVKRFPRSNYHRCAGPGRTNLDADATGAWYDSNYRGGLCSHPGDTGP
ncbi:DUF6355 family natural product biosynthesis protein [Streptomyces sp. HU2014]|uniref:Secreted protein n=1 Tax=Streptomyces albireticuli TaxID=1940 RepID=A0A1Z2LE37_9ACTN|nr:MULTISPECIES: DUF6355 family natural product biosynthesis protein [Streptomyces]ARZ72478.1 hypothetical protein SMD11_6902 [Streptomyces albireticuli]UQI45827.1 DUF6355 family natural product biosynthesis protein [Streptomyces sp. HU2014]